MDGLARYLQFRRDLARSLVSSVMPELPEFNDTTELLYLHHRDRVLQLLATLGLISEDHTTVTGNLLPVGRLEIRGDARTSLTEYIFLLLPLLLLRKERTLLSMTGVTHYPLSSTASMLQSVFAPLLRKKGFFIAVKVERFGFYGTGGGAMNVRVYPRESVHEPCASSAPEFRGARIITSSMNPALLERMRGVTAESFGLYQDHVAVLDVRNAGPGMLLQVFLEDNGVPLMREYDLPVYNAAGDLIHDEDQSVRIIHSARKELERNFVRGEWPEIIRDEFSVLQQLL